MKRMLIALVLLMAIAVIASLVHFDGEVHAVDPKLAITIRDSATWYAHPILVAGAGDPQSIYVITPAMPRDGRFAAIRVDSSSGAQSEASVTLGPQSPFRPFLPAPVRADVHGLRFRRPALHLMTFPDGRGPGVHRVDSATGRLAIVLDENGAQRTLLTRQAFNSSSAAEMLSLLSAHPGGRWIAALSRGSAGWTLYLFPRSATSRRATIQLEES